MKKRRKLSAQARANISLGLARVLGPTRGIDPKTYEKKGREKKAHADAPDKPRRTHTPDTPTVKRDTRNTDTPTTPKPNTPKAAPKAAANRRSSTNRPVPNPDKVDRPKYLEQDSDSKLQGMIDQAVTKHSRNGTLTPNAADWVEQVEAEQVRRGVHPSQTKRPEAPKAETKRPETVTPRPATNRPATNRPETADEDQKPLLNAAGRRDVSQDRPRNANGKRTVQRPGAKPVSKAKAEGWGRDPETTPEQRIDAARAMVKANHLTDRMDSRKPTRKARREAAQETRQQDKNRKAQDKARNRANTQQKRNEARAELADQVDGIKKATADKARVAAEVTKQAAKDITTDLAAQEQARRDRKRTLRGQATSAQIRDDQFLRTVDDLPAWKADADRIAADLAAGGRRADRARDEIAKNKRLYGRDERAFKKRRAVVGRNLRDTDGTPTPNTDRAPQRTPDTDADTVTRELPEDTAGVPDPRTGKRNVQRPGKPAPGTEQPQRTERPAPEQRPQRVDNTDDRTPDNRPENRPEPRPQNRPEQRPQSRTTPAAEGTPGVGDNGQTPMQWLTDQEIERRTADRNATTEPTEAPETPNTDPTAPLTQNVTVTGGGRQASPDYLNPEKIRTEPKYAIDAQRLADELSTPEAVAKFNRKRANARTAAQTDTGDPARNRANARRTLRMDALAEDLRITNGETKATRPTITPDGQRNTTASVARRATTATNRRDRMSNEQRADELNRLQGRQDAPEQDAPEVPEDRGQDLPESSDYGTSPFLDPEQDAPTADTPNTRDYGTSPFVDPRRRANNYAASNPRNRAPRPGQQPRRQGSMTPEQQQAELERLQGRNTTPDTPEVTEAPAPRPTPRQAAQQAEIIRARNRRNQAKATSDLDALRDSLRNQDRRQKAQAAEARQRRAAAQAKTTEQAPAPERDTTPAPEELAPDAYADMYDAEYPNYDEYDAYDSMADNMADTDAQRAQFADYTDDDLEAEAADILNRWNGDMADFTPQGTTDEVNLQRLRDDRARINALTAEQATRREEYDTRPGYNSTTEDANNDAFDALAQSEPDQPDDTAGINLTDADNDELADLAQIPNPAGVAARNELARRRRDTADAAKGRRNPRKNSNLSAVDHRDTNADQAYNPEALEALAAAAGMDDTNARAYSLASQFRDMDDNALSTITRVGDEQAQALANLELDRRNPLRPGGAHANAAAKFTSVKAARNYADKHGIKPTDQQALIDLGAAEGNTNLEHASTYVEDHQGWLDGIRSRRDARGLDSLGDLGETDWAKMRDMLDISEGKSKGRHKTEDDDQAAHAEELLSAMFDEIGYVPSLHNYIRTQNGKAPEGPTSTEEIREHFREQSARLSRNASGKRGPRLTPEQKAQREHAKGRRRANTDVSDKELQRRIRDLENGKRGDARNPQALEGEKEAYRDEAYRRGLTPTKPAGYDARKAAADRAKEQRAENRAQAAKERAKTPEQKPAEPKPEAPKAETAKPKTPEAKTTEAKPTTRTDLAETAATAANRILTTREKHQAARRNKNLTPAEKAQAEVEWRTAELDSAKINLKQIEAAGDFPSKADRIAKQSDLIADKQRRLDAANRRLDKAKAAQAKAEQKKRREELDRKRADIIANRDAAAASTAAAAANAAKAAQSDAAAASTAAAAANAAKAAQSDAAEQHRKNLAEINAKNTAEKNRQDTARAKAAETKRADTRSDRLAAAQDATRTELHDASEALATISKDPNATDKDKADARLRKAVAERSNTQAVVRFWSGEGDSKDVKRRLANARQKDATAKRRQDTAVAEAAAHRNAEPYLKERNNAKTHADNRPNDTQAQVDYHTAEVRYREAIHDTLGTTPGSDMGDRDRARNALNKARADLSAAQDAHTAAQAAPALDGTAGLRPRNTHEAAPKAAPSGRYAAARGKDRDALVYNNIIRDEALTTREVADATGLTPAQARTTLNRLEKAGLVGKSSEGGTDAPDSNISGNRVRIEDNLVWSDTYRDGDGHDAANHLQRYLNGDLDATKETAAEVDEKTARKAAAEQWAADRDHIESWKRSADDLNKYLKTKGRYREQALARLTEGTEADFYGGSEEVFQARRAAASAKIRKNKAAADARTAEAYKAATTGDLPADATRSNLQDIKAHARKALKANPTDSDALAVTAKVDDALKALTRKESQERKARQKADMERRNKRRAERDAAHEAERNKDDDGQDGPAGGTPATQNPTPPPVSPTVGNTPNTPKDLALNGTNGLRAGTTPETNSGMLRDQDRTKHIAGIDTSEGYPFVKAPNARGINNQAKNLDDAATAAVESMQGHSNGANEVEIRIGKERMTLHRIGRGGYALEVRDNRPGHENGVYRVESNDPGGVRWDQARKAIEHAQEVRKNRDNGDGGTATKKPTPTPKPTGGAGATTATNTTGKTADNWTGNPRSRFYNSNAAKPAEARTTPPTEDEAKTATELDRLVLKPNRETTAADRARIAELEEQLLAAGYHRTRSGNVEHPEAERAIDDYNAAVERIAADHNGKFPKKLTPEEAEALAEPLERAARYAPHNAVTHLGSVNEFRERAGITTANPMQKHTAEAMKERAAKRDAAAQDGTATITITHDEESGTILEMDDKPDAATRDVLKRSGYKWSRNLGKWYKPRSRNNPANPNTVDRDASRLEEAGHTIGTSIDNTTTDAATRAARKQESANERADRLEARAERKRKEADAATARAEGDFERLPWGGEPIKIGHHSQHRHERAIERANNSMRRSITAAEEANRAAGAAHTARRTANNDESPRTTWNRVQKLRAEVRDLERRNLSDYGKATLEHARGDLALNEQRHLDNIAAGKIVDPATAKKGDQIRDRWNHVLTITRVNKNTYSVTEDGKRAAPVDHGEARPVSNGGTGATTPTTPTPTPAPDATAEANAAAASNPRSRFYNPAAPEKPATPRLDGTAGLRPTPDTLNIIRRMAPQMPAGFTIPGGAELAAMDAGALSALLRRMEAAAK